MNLLVSLVFLVTLASAQDPPAPESYRPVLEKHGLGVDSLHRAGFGFHQGLCVVLDPAGEPTPRVVTPEELDRALTRAVAAARPVLPSKTGKFQVPAIDPKDAEQALNRLFENAAAEPSPAASAPVMAVQAERPRFEEPAFDPSWDAIRAGLAAGPKAQQKALAALAARFTKADTETGLSDDAPEALRLLAGAIQDKRGGKAAFHELNRQLKLAADLKLDKKKRFAASLRSPRPVYVALGSSHSPHFSDSQAYFERMTALLKPQGIKVTEWMAAEDPEERFAVPFLLRLHAYDALLPYLNRDASEAKALAAFLFSEKRPGMIRERASQIEALALHLSAYGRGSRAMDKLGEGILERAERGPAWVGRRAALFMKLNEGLWPRYKGRIAQAADAVLPEALLADPRLLSASPYPHWPEQSLAVAVHFPRKDSYSDWLRYFTSRGYAVGDTTPQGVQLVKTVGTVRMTVIGKMYAGDEEGFLLDAEKRRFLDTVARDLRDPALQGVVVRTHAQFYYPALFDKRVAPGKFWLDGSCRGAWYQEELERRCPTCAPVANTATGMGEITNPALFSILEGLAARKDWPAIGKDLKAALPKASSRFLGPWTPRFHTALDLLKKVPPPAPGVSSTR